jgi:hypothetical protein
MSWIQDNKFVAGLVGGTAVGVAALYFVGAKGGTRYDAAKEQFDTAVGEASSIEKGSVYPTAENRDGKSKAIEDYKKAATGLQNAFEPFRPKEIKNVAPQAFTDKLKAVNDEVLAAFEASNTKVPEAFFCGFENYKSNLARESSTGVLGYQLEAIRNLMLALAKSGPTELKNFYREALPEEDGKEFKPADAAVARPLPIEITFQGPEKAARAFLSILAKPDGQYAVIRSLRVTNAKKDAPKASDAKFEAAKPAAAAAGGGDAFGAFVLPGEEPAAPEAEKPAEAAKPAADSSRILAQVLGNEEITVFVRVDLMQFLPAKKLP